MKFQELRLAEPIVRAVTAEGYTQATPIQAQAIPPAMAGQDILGCAQTGTGKTGGFALPLLHRLAASTEGAAKPNRNGSKKRNRNTQGSGKPRALILCPTRELATQIYESFRTYGKYLPLRHTVVFGGVNQYRQVRALQAGIDVLVATPGRLLDLINQGFIDLSGVEMLVLDEADRMLDMGFIHDIRKIVERMPARRQTLLFSATMPKEIQKLADSILHNPAIVKVAHEATTADAITQSVYMVTKQNKPALLERLLDHKSVGRTLIFTRTKYGADKLVRYLKKTGFNADAIHGNKSQNARTRALDAFRSGKAPILVATDVASRGIDVDEITHVINFDMPAPPETYVHRIGRTARAGAKGVALSFCDYHEIDDLRAIEESVDRKLPVATDHSDLVFEAPAAGPKRRDSRASSRRKSSGPQQRRRRRGSSNGQSNQSRGNGGSGRSRRTRRSAA